MEFRQLLYYERYRKIRIYSLCIVYGGLCMDFIFRFTTKQWALSNIGPEDFT